MDLSLPSAILGLQYASNNEFFDDKIEFLQKIWFVSLLSIDMYVKYSFQKTNRDTIIQGAEIDTYDNDHMVNDTFFVHKIQLPHQRNISRALVYISLKHKKAMTLKEVIGFSKSIPMFSLLIFGIITAFIGGVIGKILQGITLISILIFLLFFAYKFWQYFRSLTRMNSTSLQDHRLTYLNPHDLKLFTKEIKEKIEQLQAFGVTDIALDRNVLYFKQDLIDTSESSILSELLGKKKVFDAEKKKQIMEQMIDILSQQNILALFPEEYGK